MRVTVTMEDAVVTELYSYDTARPGICVHAESVDIEIVRSTLLEAAHHLGHDGVRVQLQDDAASLAAQLGEARNEIAKLARELLMANERSRIYKTAIEEVAALGTLNALAAMCHADNRTWWHDPKTGEPLKRNHGELMMLMVSEIAEACEGDRKSKMDDHIPHRRSVEVEFADLLIRLFDYAGAYKFDLDGAFQDKRAYNAVRADHKPEARLAEGGKKY